MLQTAHNIFLGNIGDVRMLSRTSDIFSKHAQEKTVSQGLCVALLHTFFCRQIKRKKGGW